MKNYTISSCIMVSLLLLGNFNTAQAQLYGFTATPAIGCSPLEVTITNTSTDTSAYRYEWSFGDGTPVFVDTLTTTFTHTFTQAGFYYIYLYVYDSIGNYITYTYGPSGGVNVLGDVNTSPYDSACANDNVQIWGNYQATSWNWDYGDGFSGSSANYVTYHTYLADGTYDITLIQTSAYCTDTIIKQIKIVSNAIPDAVFYTNPSSPANVCPGDNITFYPSYYYGSHFWDLGDSTTSTLANYFTHVYDTSGTYPVTHILTNGCGISDTATGSINVASDNQITGSQYFSIYPGTTTCPNTSLSFYATSNYKNYIWSFGDGTPDDTTVTYYISHAYFSYGIYPVSVRILNGCGNDTVLSDTITVANTGGFGALSFNTNYSPSCTGDGVSLSTTGGYFQYAWDFGDGTSFITQGSSSGTAHIYQFTGSYSASVTIYNSCGADTTLYKTLIISDNAPFAGSFYFNANPQNSIACTGHDIQFFTRGGFTKYTWDFGDGTPLINSTASSFYHQYSSPGTYSAFVTIVNGCGADTTLTKNITITDSTTFPNTPSFKINGSLTSVCPNTKVLLSPPTGYENYLWDFGDGSPFLNAPSGGQAHYYSDTGTYYVTLVITNHCGFDTTLTATVDVIDDGIITGMANLTISPSTPCPGQVVSFSTTMAMPYYTWDFGDGVIDSVTNSKWAYHAYSQPGVYHYSLTIKNLCNQTKTTIGEITIDSNLAIPSYASLLINSTPACPGQEISLTTVPGMQSYVWNFGDGSPLLDNTLSTNNYTYSDTGIFPVAVTLTNYCGNSAVLNDTIFIGSDVGFLSELSMTVSPLPACPGDMVNITTNSGYASYTWNFGDSTTATGASTAVHSYDSTGNYNASVTILNHCGIDTLISTPVVIDTGLTPAIIRMQSSVLSACPGENISFWVDNTAYNLYLWTFGDGDTVFTTGSTVEHTYDSVGNYIASLTVFNSCGNSKSNMSSILITDDIQVPQLSVLPSSNTACIGDAIQFIAGGGSSSYQYIWNFGDGVTDTIIGATTSHTFSDTGTYIINLTAINPCGNSASFDTIINIRDSITSQFEQGEDWGISNGSNIGGCPGDAVLFFFRGTGNNLWDFGDGYSDVATEQFVVDQGYIITIIKHAYSDTGTYNVKFTYTNGCGNSTTDSMNIIIGNNFLVNGDLLIEEPVTQGGYTTCKPINFVGVGGEIYFWDFGDSDTLTSINPAVSHQYLAEGNYSVTVRITNGCGNTIILSRTVKVFNVSGLAVNTAIISQVTCNNGSDGTISANASGGQPPYSYVWSDPFSQATSDAVNLIPGTYNITVTDNIGCGVTGSATLVNPPPIVLTDTLTPASCGNNDGSATIYVASGGNAPFSYIWSDFTTGQSDTALITGTYSVTVTDASGCTASRIVAINETGAPVISLSSIGTVNCYGGNNGSVGITVTGGFAPYTYNWSNGYTLEDISSLAAGTYFLTLTDSTGCRSSLVAEVSQPSPVSVSFTVTGTNCGTSYGSATAIAGGGVSPYSYLWDDAQTTQTATGLPAGTFMITVTDANSCSITGIATVSNTNAPVITATINDVTCNGLSNGSVLQSITGGTTPYQRSWSTGEQSNNVYNKPAGQYSCFITDASGCITVRTYNISQPAILSTSAAATPATCGSTNGTASVVVTGGTSPYSYSWSNGGTASLISNLSSQSYFVTVTDVRGCQKTDSTTVTQPLPIDIGFTVTNVSCSGGSNGTATANVTGGISPYSYLWNTTPAQTVKTAITLQAGTYSVTVTDASNCTAVDSVAISQPQPLTVNAFQTDISCNGGSSGTITISAGGGVLPYLYSKNGGVSYQGSDTFGSLTVGSYSLVVKDSNNCTFTTGITLTEPTLLTLTFVKTNITCNGGGDGSIVITATGGVTPYQYSGDAGNTFQSSNIFNGLNAGNYAIVVKDNNLCDTSTTATLTEPLAITFTASQTDVNCNGAGNGSIMVSAAGGSGTLEYSDDSGSTYQFSNVFNNLIAGNYYVVVKDAQNCTTAPDSIIITSPPVISLTASSGNVNCYGGNDGSATATVSGGSPQYSYQWSNSATTSSINLLTSSIYTITVTDSLGCTKTSSVTITEPPILTATASPANILCNGDGNGAITVTAAGGAGGFRFSADSGSIWQVPAFFNNLLAGTYFVIVKDSNNCTTLPQSVSISEPTLLTFTVSQADINCYGGGDGSINIAATGGITPYQYSGNGGATFQSSNVFSSLTAGSYTVVVSDNNGCDTSATVTLTEPSAISFTTVQTDVMCYGGNDGSIMVLASGGAGLLQYSKNAGSTYQFSNSFNSLIADTYTVIVKDANNCTTSPLEVIITFPPAIAINLSSNNVSCYGGNDGTALAVVTGGTGGYSFVWSNSQTDSAITGLTAGVYTVTVNDANNCAASQQVTITEPPVLSLSISSTDAICNHYDGTATATPVGGSGSYSYWWSNAQFDATATGLDCGNYGLTVTDVNACTVTGSVSVAIISTPQDICIVTVDSATKKNLVSWEKASGMGTQGFILLKEIFTNVYDSIGYVPFDSLSEYVDFASDPKTKAERYKIATMDSCGNISLLSDSHRTILLTASVGVNNERNLAWNDYEGITSIMQYRIWRGTAFNNITLIDSVVYGTNLYADWDTLTGVDSLYYFVELVHPTGCTSIIKLKTYNSSKSNTASLEAPSMPMSIAVLVSNVSCNGGIDGTATATITGGEMPYAYAWDDPQGQSDSTATGLTAGIYNVTVTDNNSTTITGSAVITEPTAITASASVTDATSPGNNDGAIGISVTGGTPPYTFAWSNSATTEDIDSLPADTYTVVITDANNCLAVFTDTVKLIVSEFYHSQFTTHQILVYPNPNNGRFTITITPTKYGFIRTYEIRIMNILGEVVFQSAIFNPQSLPTGQAGTISLDLPEGIYSLRVEADGEVLGVGRMTILK